MSKAEKCNDTHLTRQNLRCKILMWDQVRLQNQWMKFNQDSAYNCWSFDNYDQNKMLIAIPTQAKATYWLFLSPMRALFQNNPRNLLTKNVMNELTKFYNSKNLLTQFYFYRGG